MRFGTLNDVLVGQLDELYDAERQLVATLPKTRAAAHAPELKQVLDDHLQRTRRHVSRLEEAFERLAAHARREEQLGLAGGSVDDDTATAPPDVEAAARDAAIIAAARRVEHLEIAGYGAAKAIAEELGLDDISTLLGTTLDEEKAADRRLTRIATVGMFGSDLNDTATTGR